jgi:hypothetical protein
MKNHIHPILHRLLMRSALLLAMGATLAPITVHARGRSAVVHGPRGGQYQRQASHSPGNFSASESVMLPSGRSANRSVTSQRTDTGFTRQVTATGAHGGTASKQVAISTQDGTVSRTVTTAVVPKP